MQKKCHLRSRLGQPGGAGVEARTSDQEVPGSNPRPGGDFGYLLTTPTLIVPTFVVVQASGAERKLCAPLHKKAQ